MNTLKTIKTLIASSTLVCALSWTAQAEMITNGSFESGLTGWTRANQTGSEGTFSLQTGTLSPVNSITVPAPPGGTTAAMTDAQGPGSHALYQTFTVTAPVTTTTLLSFDLFIGNRANAFSVPNTLDFATPTLNQQARVDILAGGADPFSLAASDILLNAFRTNVGTALVSGYTRYTVDVTSLLNSRLNTPLTLRFAETDNVSLFQMGVDNVSIEAAPEPSTWLLLTTGFALGAVWLRRRAANPSC